MLTPIGKSDAGSQARGQSPGRRRLTGPARWPCSGPTPSRRLLPEADRPVAASSDGGNPWRPRSFHIVVRLIYPASAFLERDPDAGAVHQHEGRVEVGAGGDRLD